MTECLQFFGGYGFMEEYKMARAYRDCRVGTIGGGTSEIMREILAKMIIDDTLQTGRF
jgi:acyl-CoA dehydrogenase